MKLELIFNDEWFEMTEKEEEWGLREKDRCYTKPLKGKECGQVTSVNWIKNKCI